MTERKYTDGAIVKAGNQKLILKIIGATERLAGWKYELRQLTHSGEINKRQKPYYFFENDISMPDLSDIVTWLNFQHVHGWAIVASIEKIAEEQIKEKDYTGMTTDWVDSHIKYGTLEITLKILKALEAYGILTKRRGFFGYHWQITPSWINKIAKDGK